MALTGGDRIALAACAGFALLMPATLLPLGGSQAPEAVRMSPVRTVIPGALPGVAIVYERALFAPAEAAADTPADAPALVGIAGRLNRDAVALVRLADGRSRSLAVGDSVEGWRLESLAIDAAFFTRGRERVRVGIEADASVDPEAQ